MKEKQTDSLLETEKDRDALQTALLFTNNKVVFQYVTLVMERSREEDY